MVVCNGIALLRRTTRAGVGKKVLDHTHKDFKEQGRRPFEIQLL